MMNCDDVNNNSETLETAVNNMTDADGVQDPEQEQLQIDIESLKTSLNESLQKQEEYLNLAQRVQADFDNFRKRNASVRKDSFDSGACEFAKTLIPVIDNFERAIASFADDTNSALLTGVNMVHKQIIEAFEKRGIKQISRLGEVFDPQLEEAVAQGSLSDGEPGTVCEVLQKGYIMDKTVIRFSMVKVVPQ